MFETEGHRTRSHTPPNVCLWPNPVITIPLDESRPVEDKLSSKSRYPKRHKFSKL
jgi:hypothetical protein